MVNNAVKGHFATIVTNLIWGTTFISTKVLLTDFQPIEILFFLFLIGLAALLIVHPCCLKGTTFRQEIVIMTAGLCGGCRRGRKAARFSGYIGNTIWGGRMGITRTI